MTTTTAADTSTTDTSTTDTSTTDTSTTATHETPTQTIDEGALLTFVDKAVGDLGAGYLGVMVSIGSRLGLYRAVAEAGPLTSHELAAHTGFAERYLRDWLSSQAAAGYVLYDASSRTFSMSPEQVVVLADDDSPFYLPAAWNTPAAMWAAEDRAISAFRTGEGITWADHDPRLAHGTASFYRNGYRASLTSQWLPALDGVVDALEAGTSVADVGSGHGHATVLMAEAFPASCFLGFDSHEESVAQARQNAQSASVQDRTTFTVARADSYPRLGFGLICFFDALHDMGDPVGALRHAEAALAPGGTVLLVEPKAGDRLEDNVNVVGQIYYPASSMICTAHGIAEGGQRVLGAQAGLTALTEVLNLGGFSRVRVVAETPFNLVIEAKR